MSLQESRMSEEVFLTVQSYKIYQAGAQKHLWKLASKKQLTGFMNII
jgi:hypothetical protein